MYTNYNINQATLEVSFSFMPSDNHIAYFINELVESLRIDHPYEFGRPRTYSLSAVIKLLLFAYSRSVFTSRKISVLSQENMVAQWLTQGGQPSASTICRCRRAPELQEIMNDGFEYLVNYLRSHRLIDDQISIDGTKLLADANKYSFVWRKNTVRFDESNREKIIELLSDMRAAYSTVSVPKDTTMTIDQLEEIITTLEVRLEELESEVEKTSNQSPNPAKQERRKTKSVIRQVKKRREKMIDHQQQFDTFGDRNSYSKTDKDATFMRMKEDPMRNGQLKPGYNLQLATSCQYALAYSLYSNPTDTRTLPSFLMTHQKLIERMTYASLDAGYGSEANYRYIEDNYPDLTALIPYGTMLKEQSKKWRTDERKVMNWEYNSENDFYIDPKGIRFNFNGYQTRTDKYGFTRDFKEYKAEKYDENQTLLPDAVTPKGYLRKIRINPSWEYFKAKQKSYAANPNYKRIYGRRKIDVETVFGFLKASLKFTRFHLRGKEKVSNEIGLVLMAYNLHKIAINKKKEEKEKQTT